MTKVKKNKSRFHKWLKSLLWAFIILLIVRSLFFQFYTVIYDKMKPALLPGDYMVVNKLSFGPRLPISFFALPFNDNFVPFLGVKSYVNIFQLPYLRLKFGKINRNNILVFNYPNMYDVGADLKPLNISRCIALPGDTLQIKDKVVFINGKKNNDTLPVLFHYRITTDGTFFSQNFLDSLHITGKLIADMGIYKFYITPKMANQLKSIPYIKYIQKISDFWNYNSTLCFPENSKTIGWNKDYFGTVVIPAKGQTVNLTLQNIDIYRKIITNYENNDLTIDETAQQIVINGKVTDTYTFRQNYFFVMDDNRDMAKDSRYWGFLPESHIVGKASVIWLSIAKNRDSSKIRWDRMFQ
ncbi:MAG: signal peptidase I [Bacteroidales bacterium]|nr:signal peptidase I [Bacteroidales bacterium]